MSALEAVKRMKESLVKSHSAAALHDVEFTFPAPNAKKVCITGRFNDWNMSSLPMKKDRDGTWRVKLKLSPGRYEYKYVVDGTWVQDTPCTDLVLNPYGTYNCVIAVQ